MQTAISKYLPLGAGLLLLLLGREFQWPLAALAAPVLLMRFMRRQPPLRGILLAGLGSTLVILWVFRGLKGPMFNNTGTWVAVMTVSTLLGMLPLLIDRLLVSRFSPLLGTLLYPASKVLVEWLGSLNSPFGFWGTPAALMSGWLPLVQLVAFTGVWGISWLAGWLASLLNLLWERGGRCRPVIKGLLIYTLLLAMVLTAGWLRLRKNPPARQVRMATVLANDSLFIPLKQFVYRNWPAYTLRQLPADSLTALRQLSRRNLGSLLSQSAQAATAGARLVCWAEGNGILEAEQQATLLGQAGRLAKEKGIYLALALEVFHDRKDHPVENKILLLDPQGRICFEYLKSHPLGPENQWMLAGPRTIALSNTSVGKLAALICFDSDFISYARESGQAGADILLAPSNDWQEIAALRAGISRYRAVENGLTLVRPTSHGVTEVVDSRGRVLEQNNYFEKPRRLLLADIPSGGERTFYARTGDWFPLLAAGLLLILLFSTVKINRHAKTN